MTPPLIELGGLGPVVHLAPANGFPPETYRPALGPVTADHRVISLPPRAMWPDVGDPPAGPGSWSSLADDLLAGLRQHSVPPVIAVGHSFGAVVSLLAATRDRPLFRGLALLDPTILPPGTMDDLRIQRARGEMSFRPLVQGARKRRDRFASEAEAFDYWRSKPLFQDWSAAAVRGYAGAMLSPEAGGLTLKWKAAWEAYYYESFYPDTWADVARLDRSLPVLIVGGSASDTFLPEAVALLRERVPWATHATIEGRGHLFPQSAPEETGKILASWVETIRPESTGPAPSLR